MKLAAVLSRVLPPAWFGMAVAIAIEAWLKFQAPGVTREIGLGIGRLVFTAINRVELVVAAVLTVAILLAVRDRAARLVFALVIAILLVQTHWLIPLLVERIDMITSGVEPARSPVHVFYVAAEVVKMLLLLSLSILLNRPNAEWKRET